MSIRSTVISQIEQISSAGGKQLPPLTEELALLDLGLDSLGIAILVTRLEDTLGLDPFTSDNTSLPVTLGEFIAAYEHVARAA